ncbi:MAG: hypothetical protein ACI4DZ_08630 [Oliverpabstia sp.]
MEEKNRFSKLLEYLMSVAELKNYTLAQQLQYDVSYISKWVSGRMLPAEKMEKKILEGISCCIVESATEEGKNTLLQEYSVDDCEDLKLAIFDNLEAEYFYVRGLQKNTGTNVAAKTVYYPELTLPQFISKMRHPVLRRVKSLDIVASMDLMSMGHEYRLQFTRIENEHEGGQRGYPDVHFSMVISLRPEKWDYIYDTIFLINMLTDNILIDFQLYADVQAGGRAVFAVKDDFAISAMLISRDRCMSVNVSEDKDNCNVLYRNLKVLCNRERLLFRSANTRDMMRNHDYIHTLLSPNIRWLMGHMTEHFLPEDLFEEIVRDLEAAGKLSVSSEELRSIHRLLRTVMRESPIRLMLYESAFSSFVVTNELDFYNLKIKLSVKQQIRYMEHLIELCEKCENLNFRLVYGQFVSDFEYIDNQCIFLTDTISYLRLKSSANRNDMLIINRTDMQRVFERSFEEFWNYGDAVVISDKEAILSYMQHILQGVKLISRIE